MDTIPLSLPDMASLLLEPAPVQMFWEQYAWGIKIALLLLIAQGIYGFIRYRRFKDKRLFARSIYSDNIGYRWLFHFEGDIAMSARLRAAITGISANRQMTKGPLSIQKTVAAVARTGVLIQPVFTAINKPDHYLFLIERISYKDHRANTYNLIFREFCSEDIPASCFFYSNDIRNCQNEEYPNGITPPQLFQLYPESRLIIIGSGYHFIDLARSRLVKWSSAFDSWRHKAIFSFTPPAQWGRRERLLKEKFLLLPASVNSFSILPYVFDETNLSSWEDYDDVAWVKPIVIEGDLINSLSAQLDTKLIRWVAACAVYPDLQWGMTLFLGQLIAKHEGNECAIDDLFELCRLPWFIDGSIPLETRKSLLAYLEVQEPELHIKIRESLLELLAKNPPPQDSFDYEEYRMVYALNEWLTTKDKRRKNELKNELESRLSAGADPFWDIVVYLDRQRNPLDFAVPSTWKKYINRASPTSIRDILAGTVVFMLFASLILWFRPSYFIGCAGEKLELNSRMYCLTNREDSILLKRHAIIRFVQQGDTKGLNNLLIQAYRQMDTTDSRLLFETAAISWYNQGVYYREGDLDTSNVSTASLEKACFCFQQVVKIKNTYLPDYLFPKIDRAISNCQLQ